MILNLNITDSISDSNLHKLKGSSVSLSYNSPIVPSTKKNLGKWTSSNYVHSNKLGSTKPISKFIKQSFVTTIQSKTAYGHGTQKNLHDDKFIIIKNEAKDMVKSRNIKSSLHKINFTLKSLLQNTTYEMEDPMQRSLTGLNAFVMKDQKLKYFMITDEVSVLINKVSHLNYMLDEGIDVLFYYLIVQT